MALVYHGGRLEYNQTENEVEYLLWSLAYQWTIIRLFTCFKCPGFFPSFVYMAA